MDIEIIIGSIAAGEFDAVLEPLNDLVQARRQMLNEQKKANNKIEFVPGTRVRICGNIRPKYLLGITGTVSVRMPSRRGDIRVDIDPIYRSSMGRYNDSIPANCLEAV
jgi:hypothetical protein